MAEPTDGCPATCAIHGYSGTTSFDFARSFIYARLAEVVADCPTLHWKSPMMGPFPIKASDNPESKDRVWSISVNADISCSARCESRLLRWIRFPRLQVYKRVIRLVPYATFCGRNARPRKPARTLDPFWKHHRRPAEPLTTINIDFINGRITGYM